MQLTRDALARIAMDVDVEDDDVRDVLRAARCKLTIEQIAHDLRLSVQSVKEILIAADREAAGRLH